MFNKLRVYHAKLIIAAFGFGGWELRGREQSFMAASQWDWYANRRESPEDREHRLGRRAHDASVLEALSAPLTR
jgi:hypothetical protein